MPTEEREDPGVLRIQSRADGYYAIAWWFRKDNEGFGIAIGERLGAEVCSPSDPPSRPLPYTEADLAAADGASWAHIALSVTAARLRPILVGPFGTFWWPTRNEAKWALTALRRVLAGQDLVCPWPQWALAAHAAGWTPPKGWKP